MRSTNVHFTYLLSYWEPTLTPDWYVSGWYPVDDWDYDDDDVGDDDTFVESLNGGKFHSHLRDVFAPQVVRYIDLMESSIAQSINSGFEKETWKPQG